MSDTTAQILEPGRNCRQLLRADRAAVLLNGEAYFAAFYQAVLRARRQLFIVGWDIHSKVELLRGDAAVRARSQGLPTRLGYLLDHAVRHNPDLDVRILIWDFSMLLSLERDPNLLFNLGWVPHPRIHFYMDGDHPVGASHHQKIVVVDGQVAFCGGLDLTHHRWDTAEHVPDDPRRTTPTGEHYGPFHDVMVMVDGKAAAGLGELCAIRWERAARSTVRLTDNTDTDTWPSSIRPWFEDVDIAIVRTEPRYKSRREVREVEALYLDAIQAAEHSIFIENQYFTSPVLCEALEKRLREEHGPDVVIILPKKIGGWLGEKVMEARLGKVLDRLTRADVHDRLRLRHPWVGNDPKQGVMVHAKLMIVDDRLLRVGSANLCNRSMGLDTECDLAIEARNPEQEAGIRRLRNELLAEHLGGSAGEIDELARKTGSLVRLVDQLSTSDRQERVSRGLGPLEAQEEQFPELVSEAEILDPERPLEIDRLMDAFVSGREAGQEGWLKANWLWMALGACALVGLGLAWRFTGLSEIANRESLAILMREIDPGWGLYFLLLLGFLVGGLLMFPVTVLIGAVVILLDPLPALIIAIVGTQLSAMMAYIIGMRLGRNRIRYMAGSRLNRISRHLARHGIVSVAVIRTLPIAPFTIINLVAGASHIRFPDYVLGTLVGMMPGILAATIFMDQLLSFLYEPDWTNVLIMLGAMVFVVLATRWLKRRFS